MKTPESYSFGESLLKSLGEVKAETAPSKCPTCGGAAVQSCRCFLRDHKCANDHHWADCFLHGPTPAAFSKDGSDHPYCVKCVVPLVKEKVASEGKAEETFNFAIDGRSKDDVEKMKKLGYVELDRFGRLREKMREDVAEVRTDGYFCGSCPAFQLKPNTMPKNPGPHDGFCQKFKFPDRDYGCCSGWYPKDQK